MLKMYLHLDEQMEENSPKTIPELQSRLKVSTTIHAGIYGPPDGCYFQQGHTLGKHSSLKLNYINFEKKKKRKHTNQEMSDKVFNLLATQ